MMKKDDDNWKTSTDYLYSNADGDDKFVMYKMGDEEKRDMLTKRIAELHSLVEVLSQQLYKLEQKEGKAKDNVV